MSGNVSCPNGCGIDHIIGIEVPEVYDGVLFWTCECGSRWHRWPEGTRQHQRAIPFVASPPQSAVEMPVGGSPAREGRKDG